MARASSSSLLPTERETTCFGATRSLGAGVYPSIRSNLWDECQVANTCGKHVHSSCASLPRSLKVVHHKYPLHLTHSYLEVELHQSDSRFCQLYVQKENTNYGFYYCSKCDFVAHLDCAVDYSNRETINLLELKKEENEDLELDQSVNSTAYEIKNIKVGEDGIEIAT
ncbi:hypothetical protein CFP56_018524 [Quercus suber]|uniref:DC1 domain-containing protein n=1 Tax=Quercus suber TaxID=58331 RepID=A0AAW0M172_QUESU